MELVKLALFRPDPASGQIISISPDSYGSDFGTYLEDILHLIISSERGRKFHIDKTEAIHHCILNLLNDPEHVAGFESIAQLLASCELQVQTRMEKLGVEIQKGLFIQAVVKHKDHYRYVACKADHSDFLNGHDLSGTSGLTVKKKFFKAYSCLLHTQGLSNHIVYDTNASPSAYWWKDFLSLRKGISDEDNTEAAFSSIDKSFFTRYLKKDFPQDYTLLRNSMIRYFRARKEFELDDFIEEVFEGYQPISERLNIDDLKNKVRLLPSSKIPFDAQFTIVTSRVQAKFHTTISLSDQIDLVLKEDISNLEHIITTGEDYDGTRYVKIKTDYYFR